MFVHHQGRGHAERAAALANAIESRRGVTLFSARPDMFPALRDHVETVRIPSLFEPDGREAPELASHPTPDTLHCAPLGWPGITRATAMLAHWFDEARPALFVTDVSAELGQFARICSVPHIAVFQHGCRGDPGHMASYASAIGLLAPYHRRLEQDDRPGWMRDKTWYAPGLGIDPAPVAIDQAEARRALDLPQDATIVLVIAGGGGGGTPCAPLTIGARSMPDSLWVTVGALQSAWHETPPGNLVHKGWVDNPHQWIAAADRIVSSCGNTTVQMLLAAGKPWMVIPEWRYFDEQVMKARVLRREGLAAVSEHWPSHSGAWAELWAAAGRIDPAQQRSCVMADAAGEAAAWLEGTARRIWAGTDVQPQPLGIVA